MTGEATLIHIILTNTRIVSGLLPLGQVFLVKENWFSNDFNWLNKGHVEEQ